MWQEAIMGDQRNTDDDGMAGEEGWRDDAAPTSPSDLDIDSDLDEDDEGGADDMESGAGYGNNPETPPNPD